ncbi:MAG TPA: chemotaxis protein CheW [Pyrinomonadaceae bacterium]
MSARRFSQSFALQFTMSGEMKERRQLFVMRTGAHLFAVYRDEVEATCENLTPTPLPFAPPPVRGIVSRRGRMLTLIDPHALLHGSIQQAQAQILNSPAAMQTPYVVALKGDEQLALAVESIEHEIELYDDDAADVEVEASDQTPFTSSAASPAAATNATDATGASKAAHAFNASPPLVRRHIPYRARTVALLDTARLFESAMRGVERRRQRT